MDEKVMPLLQELETLNLIRLINVVHKTNTKTNWSAVKGAMKKQDHKTIEKQLKQLRSEWE